MSFARSSAVRRCGTALLLSVLMGAAPVCAQAPRQVAARYAADGVFQAAVFVDGEARVDDPVIQAFAAALLKLTPTLYSDDRFDLQSGQGSFVFNYAGGRLARVSDGVLFLHFGVPPIVALGETLDGVLYPARPAPETQPPRLTFTLIQVVPTTKARLAWHASVTLRLLPKEP
jgi:hypothetical protein